MKALQQQRNPLLEIKQLHGEHGFSNPSAVTYNEQSTTQVYKIIDSFLMKTML
jgi:hypothetical protein